MSDSFLQLRDNNESEHLLPYGHLLHAQLFPPAANNDAEAQTPNTPACQILVLMFAAHNVTISGSQLANAFSRIRTMKIHPLAVGTHYAGDNPFTITSVVVTERSEDE